MQRKGSLAETIDLLATANRTMPVITMLNTAQRNGQIVSTVIANAQIRGFNLADEKKKVTHQNL